MDNLETESIVEETQIETELEQPTEQTEVMEEAEAEEVEAIESESEDEQTEAEDDVQELLSLDGEEVDLETVRKWKNGHLMQEDYTRKTQALADERKSLKAKADELDHVVSELEAELLSDFDPDELVKLRDYDPSEYLKQKEQLEARKAKIAAAKSKAAKARDELDNKSAEVERQKLLQANPDWVDATGNTTEKYKADVEMMNKYLAEQGWSTEEVAGISTAKMWNIIKEAAQLKAQQAKGAALTKKVKKTPTVTKPQSTQAAPPKARTVGTMLYGD